MGNAGTKIREGFDWVGKKMNEGWENVKAFGKKAWDTVKRTPVIGRIAEGVEKYTPIGWAASNLIRGIDTGVGTTSRLFQGDAKGAYSRLSSGIRETINQKNPLVEKLKEVPVLGKAVGFAESQLEKVPVFGGMSVSDMRNIGNAALDTTDALSRGDAKGALRSGAKGFAQYASAKSGGLGKAIGGAKAINAVAAI